MGWLLLAGTASAQTINPSFWGMNYATPTQIAQPKIFAGNVRVWTSNVGGFNTQWGAMETCRPTNPANQNDPCYSWSSMDTLTSWAQGTGANIVYTFGNIPGWANANAGMGAPPTSFTDFYNFVTALATRYKGKGIIYEGWNEFNSTSGYWTGTIAQMVTLFSQECSIVHSIDTTARVTTPSSSNFNGIAAMDSFLSGGGGNCADIMAIHGYPINLGNATPYGPPEQTWEMIQTYLGMFSYYGYGSRPFVITEGFWTSLGGVTTVPQETAWTVVYASLIASGGIAFQDWYIYDLSPGGELSDGGTWLNATGQAYRTMVSWLSGATFSSPITRIANTNQIRNPSGSGAVAGTQGTCSSTTQGTPPTNWSIGNPDSTHGMFTSVVGSGTENGIPYVDIRFCGTATTGAGGGINVVFETANHIVASNGQMWTPCIYTKLIAGSTAGFTQFTLQYWENNSSGSFLDGPLNYIFNILPYALQTQPQCFQAVNDQSSVAYVQPLFGMNYPLNTPLDITIRFGSPSMDNGSQWSGTTNKGQIVWDANGATVPSSFSTALGFTWTSDGRQTPVTGGTVTLTNLPQMLESAVQGGWTP